MSPTRHQPLSFFARLSYNQPTSHPHPYPHPLPLKMKDAYSLAACAAMGTLALANTTFEVSVASNAGAGELLYVSSTQQRELTVLGGRRPLI